MSFHKKSQIPLWEKRREKSTVWRRATSRNKKFVPKSPHFGRKKLGGKWGMGPTLFSFPIFFPLPFSLLPSRGKCFPCPLFPPHFLSSPIFLSSKQALMCHSPILFRSMIIQSRVVGWAGKWTTTPIRMRTRVRFPGSTLIRRRDNLAYVGNNTPTTRVRIKPDGD